MRSVEALIQDDSGNTLGTLTVSTLPNREHHLDREDDRIALEEDGTYVFRIDDVERVVLDPAGELGEVDVDRLRRSRGSGTWVAFASRFVRRMERAR